MNEANFVKGDLSTDYLDRFKIFDKMNQEVRDEASRNGSAAVAAALLYTELVKRSGSSSYGNNNNDNNNANRQISKWKMARVTN
jgi:acetyl-CoA/propionyl-CoA carboxylase